jgi:hypothetical protein
MSAESRNRFHHGPTACCRPAKASSSDLLVIDLEVATVTDTSVIITWFTGSATQTDSYGFPLPATADTELQLGQVDLTTLTVVPGSLTTGVGGSLDYPGIFTTLTTPPGSYLFTLALSNDLRPGHLRVRGDGPSFDIDRPTSIALQRLYERTPGVFFHHSGHTHRNKRTFLPDDQQNPIQSVEFLEVGAIKEYPGGYSLLRLYTGGYTVSYYKNRTQLALAWAQRSRHEYYTVTRDLSGLTPLS